MNRRELARIASEAMETAKRGDGSMFLRFAENAPEWCLDLSREAHGGTLPDDWRYRFIADALETIAGCEEDDYSEAVDGAVSVYTADRLAWLASNVDRLGYVDEATEESGRATVIDSIVRGECLEREEVLWLVVSFLDRLDLDE